VTGSAGGFAGAGASGTPGSAPGRAQRLFGGGLPDGATRTLPRGGRPPGFSGGAPRFAGGGAGAGGASVSAGLVRALESTAGSYRWVATTSGSTSAADYELATGGDPVMAIGGFNNNGGELSLAQFIRYVHAGDIHYYIATGGAPSASATSRISAWVSSHFTAKTIGGVTVYDLTA
jgi:hypothetical protein